MRVVSAFGAALFAYLTLIPFSLIASAFDSACTGPGCSSSLAVEVLLIVLYAAALLTLGTTAILFADHAIRGRSQALALAPVALRACGAVIGVTLFTLFCTISPLGGLLATLIGVATLRYLRRFNPPPADPAMIAIDAAARHRREPPPGDPTLN